MIVKKTRQLGNFGTGISLYVPKRRKRQPFLPSSLGGLALWLKADAGVSKFSYNYISQIIITGTSNPSFAGTYTANSVPTWDAENFLLNNYSLSGSEGRSIAWNVDDLQFVLSSTESAGSFVSGDGANWSAVYPFVAQVIIIGFTGTYAGANGTYNRVEENFYTRVGGGFYIDSDSLHDSATDVIIATAPANYSGSWTPTTYLSTVTITGAGTTSANGTYTAIDTHIIPTELIYSASGGRTIVYDGDWFIRDSAQTYLYGSAIFESDWYREVDADLPVPTGSTGTSPRSVGSPTSTSSFYPSGSISGSVTTSTANTDDVIGWADQSGNGKHATPLAESPTLTTISSKSFVSFNGVDQALSGANVISNLPCTIISVVRVASYLGEDLWFEQYNGTDSIGLYANGDAFGWTAFNGLPFESTDAPWPTNTTQLATTIFNSGSSEHFRNGLAEGTGDSGSTTPAGPYYLSYYAPVDSYKNYDIAEIIVYNRVLTTPERQQVEAYLNTKYEIY